MGFFERVRFIALYVAFACMCIHFIAQPAGMSMVWYGVSAILTALAATLMDILKELVIDREGD